MLTNYYSYTLKIKPRKIIAEKQKLTVEVNDHTVRGAGEVGMACYGTACKTLITISIVAIKINGMQIQ